MVQWMVMNIHGSSTLKLRCFVKTFMHLCDPSDANGRPTAPPGVSEPNLQAALVLPPVLLECLVNCCLDQFVGQT